MSTVDITELRREIEEHCTAMTSPHWSWDTVARRADRILAKLPLLLDELEHLRADVSAVRDAAHRRILAYQKGDEQLCADVRTIRLNLTEVDCCDACKPAVLAAVNNLGELLAEIPEQP